MDYNKVGIWLKGYLDAIQSGEEVTKAQLELLISRIKELISEVEENDTASVTESEDLEDDDLPF
ncbi:hypothetical protein ADIS_3656 [Lunatimonas lonarensis]|uniref:Uncharacterized protein n=1 Tax=Lunatimonas lonarensis TaxID=1232681 RepID=R7ZNS9_9BACT|nr:hypothetical protein [Lunatimonas lonarensis]EON75765.1 hypothetical protein ADIS_3656 [Lunatimonas lonarensis]